MLKLLLGGLMQTHSESEDDMDLLRDIGILLGGLGIFFMGLGALYWMSIQEEEKKEKKKKKE